MRQEDERPNQQLVALTDGACDWISLGNDDSKFYTTASAFAIHSGYLESEPVHESNWNTGGFRCSYTAELGALVGCVDELAARVTEAMDVFILADSQSNLAAQTKGALRQDSFVNPNSHCAKEHVARRLESFSPNPHVDLPAPRAS